MSAVFAGGERAGRQELRPAGLRTGKATFPAVVLVGWRGQKIGRDSPELTKGNELVDLK